jgi:hypothetical protein
MRIKCPVTAVSCNPSIAKMSPLGIPSVQVSALGLDPASALALPQMIVIDKT